MTHITIDEMLPLLRREAIARAGHLLAIFFAVSLLFLFISFFWNEKYTSSVQLYLDESNTAAPTIGTGQSFSEDRAGNRVKVVKKELFTPDNLDRILDGLGITDASTSADDRQQAREGLTHNTSVYDRKNQLIAIDFYHSDPAMAFKTTSLFAEIILKTNKNSFTDETADAFEFIISQVESYRIKLEDSENRLERFRALHPDISSSIEGDLNARIMELRLDYEQTSLLYAQVDQRRLSLQAELAKESVPLVRISAEADAQRLRMVELKVLLDKETQHTVKTSQVENQLAELTRDYKINSKIYEELLSQRENARLTMAIAAEQQGIVYRVHRPANFPARSDGLRFIYVAVTGVVLACVLPFICLFVFLKVDPRIRTASALTEMLELPLLSVVPHMSSPQEKPSFVSRRGAVLGAVGLVCVLYVVVFLIKLNLESATGGTLL